MAVHTGRDVFDKMPARGEFFSTARTKLLAAAGAALRPVAGVAVIVTERLMVLAPLAWYVGKAFHLGFIPLVIVLGMRTEPRPKLVDLLTPM